MKPSKAIVTLAIGDRYERLWNQVCQLNWRAYCDRHGYDLICFNRPLDDSERARRRSPSWQKCLILGHERVRRYDRVVWIDADILLNAAAAPCVVAGVPEDKVGAVPAWSQPTRALFLEAMRRMYQVWGPVPIASYTPEQYYENHGLPSGFDEVAQAGVMVLSPQHHRDLLERTYFDYEDRGGQCSNYEQPFLSYEILKDGRAHWIDTRFNTVWYFEQIMHYPFLLTFDRALSSRVRRRLAGTLGLSVAALRKACLTATFLRSYFLHFPATLSDMSLVDVGATSWQRCRI